MTTSEGGVGLTTLTIPPVSHQRGTYDRSVGTAEDRIIAAARTGGAADLTDLPEGARAVDADFLRRLYLGRHPDATADELDPRGPRLIGAVVAERLDLSYATVEVPIRLERCVLHSLACKRGRLRELALSGTRVLSSGVGPEAAIGLAGVSISGNLVLGFGFSTAGQVNALGGHIGGQFDMSGAVLTGIGAGGAATLLLGNHSGIARGRACVR